MKYRNDDSFQDPDEVFFPIRHNGDLGNKSNRKKGIAEARHPRMSSSELQMIGQEFSYRPSRHERVWINQSLGEFFEQHWFEDILRLIKGGKEANVYLCRASETVTGLKNSFMAAKVYRPRRFRNLKNDHLYREGRGNLDGDGNLIKDDGMLHAMAKRTEFGNELLHTSWIEHEVKTMQLLNEAGADAPQVFASGNNAILMTYVGDEKTAAPVLQSISLSRRESLALFEKIMANIDLMLGLGRIHGDLSAYNILYWEGEIYLIDFPQAIDPKVNRNAYWIFERDVAKICEYFERQGVKSNPQQIALELWNKHHLKTVPDVHPALLDAEDDRDRVLWKKMSQTN